MSETKKEYTFKIGEKEFKIKTPTILVEQEAGRVYAKEFRDALTDGLIPRERLDDRLIELKVIDKEFVDKVEKKFDQLDELLTPLSKGGIKLSEMEDRARKAQRIRVEIANDRSYRSRYDNLTAERRAEDARISYLIYSLLECEGKRTFSSFEEMKKCQDAPLLTGATETLYEMLFPQVENYWKYYPENEFLIKYGIFDNDLKDTKATKVEFLPFLDEEGAPIEVK